MQKIFFFYGEIKIETDHAKMTGSQIKELIASKVPGFDQTQELILEGHGKGQDEVIGDTTVVDFEHGGGEGAKHFFSRPPTNFG